ncbi:MAG TPA: hypothetical protein P5186_09190 [Candidatus Paceibacterota bacterium]|nr:hypothetical protein [Verrucomicrobiota bacterium]HRY48209.1 hypothetical protein [Candidatus Paceibacterota bacterium]HSA00837.1 hypothetical protein [Candidatus Paceibacterota bacterium]
MKGQNFKSWSDMGLHQEPTPDELDHWRKMLAEHPEQREDFELDYRLNQALRQLPKIPVSSNFTHRVLMAASQQPILHQSRRWSRWLSWIMPHNWIRATAVAGLALGFGGWILYQQQQQARMEMARNLSTLSQLIARSSPETINDFETIHRLSVTDPMATRSDNEALTDHADMSLLIALQ